MVLHHAYLQSAHENFQPWLQKSTGWLYHGHNSVVIFIVLSGYCLMMPVVKHGNIRGGTIDFYLRRAKRILPPYYIVLLLSLLAISLSPILNSSSGTQWDSALPALNATSIISHLFLLHNLNSNWIFKINPPLWSVAVEFQIYLLFPLILIPLFKKCGASITVAIAFLLGFSPLFLLHKGEGTSPWFFGLFALGMAAAQYNFSMTSKRSTELLLVLFALTSVIFVVLTSFFFHRLQGHFYVTDIVCGLSSALFLALYFDLALDTERKKHRISSVLESKPIVGLGIFSYSLYLTHMPILAWIDLTLRRIDMSADIRFAVLFCLGVPLCISLSYVFYLLVERRFTKPVKTRTLE